MAKGLATLAAMIAMPACAKDYPPVRCAVRQPYAGRALHAPVSPALDGTIPDAPLPADAAGQLDRAFAAMQAVTHAGALDIAVGRIGEGTWSRRQTSAEQPRLWWASAGKMFVAVTVLQLVDEGKFSLDDRVSRWVQDVPNGDVVTVRDLLAHTSGLFSANEDLRVHARPHRLERDEMLAILRRHGAMFCPGANWRYSNSGYDLLGAIVEAVDRRPLADTIEARIVRPLGLTSIVVLRSGARPAAVATPSSAKGNALDFMEGGAAGPIVGNAPDMVRFLSALLGGKLLKPETVTTMFDTLYPMFDPGTFYGLGAMVFEVSDGERRDLWLGHAGGGPGVSAIIAYSPADRIIVAAALTGDAPAAAVTNAIFKTLRRRAR